MKRSFHKWTSIILSLVLLMAALSGCGGSGAAPGGGDSGHAKVKLKLANMYAEDSYESQSMKKFKELVESKADWITVDVYSNAVLGSEETITDIIRQGTVEIGVIGTSASVYLPLFAIPEYPYMFDNYDEARTITGDEKFVEMTTVGADKNGIKFLGYSPAGYRMISSNKPIESMADLKGFRLRVPNIPIYLDWAKNLGVNSIAMSLSELFTALEQKVVDGQENPYNVIIANKFYEVQPYVLESRHILTTHGWFTNQKWWDSLDDETKAVLDECAKESISYCWDITIDGEKTEADYLTEKGVTIIKPDEEFKQQMIDAEAPLKEDFIKNNPGSEEIFQYLDELKSK